MLKVLLCCVFIVTTVYGSGELSILHHPNSLIFKGHDHIKESTLKELYSAALGFSIEHYSNWHGLYIEDPFNLPQALVTVVVDGVADIGLQKGHHFPLRTDEDDSFIFESLEKRILQRYPESENSLVHLEMSNGLSDIQKYEIFQGIKNEQVKLTSNLKLSVEEDREFLKEVGLLNSIAKKVEKGVVKKHVVPDVFWFKLTGLHALSDLYGENSTSAKEAKQLLNEAILHINNGFVKAYDGAVLVSVITSDAAHTRRTRSILADTKDDANDGNEKTKYNLASHYNKDYPVIFNIILWFGVVMAFAILAICLAIGNMDPGRDSIIYRMTSTRMKKDN